MSRTGYFLARALFIAAIYGVSTHLAASQVTIFNIPTADTQPKRSFTIEADFIEKPVRFRDGGYRTYAYRAVYGLNNKTDIGANFFFTRDGSGSAGEMQFHAKRMFYRNESSDVAASFGALAFLPMENSSPARAGAMFYTNISKGVRSVRGLRLTAGGYTVAGGGKEFGSRTGVLAGIEQPLTRRWSFVADWSSGNNRFGYAAAGLNLNISPRQYLMGGYNFGNSGRGNNSLSVFYGYTF